MSRVTIQRRAERMCVRFGHVFKSDGACFHIPAGYRTTEFIALRCTRCDNIVAEDGEVLRVRKWVYHRVNT